MALTIESIVVYIFCNNSCSFDRMEQKKDGWIVCPCSYHHTVPPFGQTIASRELRIACCNKISTRPDIDSLKLN